MAVTLVAEATHIVGTPTVIEGRSPTTHFSLVFEDDAMTGYLYALDYGRDGNPICDAVQIYTVREVTDRGRPSVIQIAWSRDGQKAVLLINQDPHAVFDFAARRGYCRTGYPPPDRGWTSHGHGWDDAAMELFQ